MPAKIIVKMNVTNHAKAPAASWEAAGAFYPAERGNFGLLIIVGE